MFENRKETTDDVSDDLSVVSLCIARKREENGRVVVNRLKAEVVGMIAAAWLMLSTLLYSLQLSTGSFPKPLTAEEERFYLERTAQGDIEARNILVERNLRLVAHIMNNG